MVATSACMPPTTPSHEQLNRGKNMSANNNEKLASEGRRRLLKSLAAGGAAAAFLPEKWTKPVIDRILVPAHAQGSPCLHGIYTNYTNSTTTGVIFNNTNSTTNPVILNNHCSNKCIAFDVKTNSMVIGYVNGSSGIGYIESSGVIKPNPFPVAGCGGGYSLVNCMVSYSCENLNGFIQGNNCTSGLFVLSKVAAMPPPCINCPPVPV